MDINKNTAEKYWWVFNHPKLNQCAWSSPVIELTPHMVNPENDTIEGFESLHLNTKLQWWVEVIYQEHNTEISVHDWRLDCGGDTVDEAIGKLYILVLNHYGEYDE